MTDVSEADVPPQTNGFGDEDERTKMRPADIDADVREMERRRRVEMVMSSRLFREELERIIELQMKDGHGPGGLLQQISDMMGIQGGRLQSTNFFKSSNCVVPINDIRGVESMGYGKGEKILRCKVAAVYRLMDLYGWTQNIYNHITARLNQDQEHFLVNPWGMLYHEITASSLVKVDMQGHTVEQGTTNYGVNTAGFQLHAAVHSARPDLKCVIHLHTPSVLAVSSLKCGLLPLCKESIVIGEVSQHSYLGSMSEPEEKEKLARDLGPVNKVLFLTNHGAVCCGESIEEAFYNVYNTVLACETQLKLIPVGLENLQLIPDETRKQIYDSARNAPEGTAPPPSQIDKKEKPFRIGSLEFEALMRMMDNAGFRTGYIYRQPLVKGDPPKPRNDIEVPPAVSSLGYLLEEEGNWKKYVDGRKSNDRTRWLNSPNVYQKVEILETGTPDPKKITKWVEANAEEWVAEGSPQHSSTPVKIESALQFVPKNTNPKEFKKLQQQIKENRRADKITSGPQSHILEGVSWEEAKKLQDANISQTGDQVILVGAASKGIIQRGFQHNATVYKAPYAKNPFDAVSDAELEDYKQKVSRKQKGESSYDEDESEALSSSAALPPTGIKSPASETETESRDEPRVLRIETKQVPRASQAEVVLSDARDSLDQDLGPTLMQRSKSSRYPGKEPVSPLNRSNSLPRHQQNNKDACPKVTGFGSTHKEAEVQDSLLPPNLKIFNISTDFAALPSSCEVVTLPESQPDPNDGFDFIKKNVCDMINNNKKTENLNSSMVELVKKLRSNMNKMKLARKRFFEDANNHTSKKLDLEERNKEVVELDSENNFGRDNNIINGSSDPADELGVEILESGNYLEDSDNKDLFNNMFEEECCIENNSNSWTVDANKCTTKKLDLEERNKEVVEFEIEKSAVELPKSSQLVFVGTEPQVQENCSLYDKSYLCLEWGDEYLEREPAKMKVGDTQVTEFVGASSHPEEDTEDKQTIESKGSFAEEPPYSWVTLINDTLPFNSAVEDFTTAHLDSENNFGRDNNIINGSSDPADELGVEHLESDNYLEDSDNEDLFNNMFEEECCIEKNSNSWTVDTNKCTFGLDQDYDDTFFDPPFSKEENKTLNSFMKSKFDNEFPYCKFRLDPSGSDKCDLPNSNNKVFQDQDLLNNFKNTTSQERRNSVYSNVDEESGFGSSIHLYDSVDGNEKNQTNSNPRSDNPMEEPCVSVDWSEEGVFEEGNGSPGFDENQKFSSRLKNSCNVEKGSFMVIESFSDNVTNDKSSIEPDSKIIAGCQNVNTRNKDLVAVIETDNNQNVFTTLIMENLYTYLDTQENILQDGIAYIKNYDTDSKTKEKNASNHYCLGENTTSGEDLQSSSGVESYFTCNSDFDQRVLTPEHFKENVSKSNVSKNTVKCNSFSNYHPCQTSNSGCITESKCTSLNSNNEFRENEDMGDVENSSTKLEISNKPMYTNFKQSNHVDGSVQSDVPEICDGDQDLRINSPDSFKTISVESITLDIDMDYMSDECEQTFSDDNFEEIEVHSRTELAFNTIINVEFVDDHQESRELSEEDPVVFNTYIDEEFEGGCDYMSSSVLDNEQELYCLEADKEISRMSSPEHHSIDYKVVLPINKPSFGSFSSSQESQHEKTTPSPVFQEINLVKNNPNYSPSLNKLNFDIKVPTFIVFDPVKIKQTPKSVKKTNSTISFNATENVSLLLDDVGETNNQLFENGKNLDEETVSESVHYSALFSSIDSQSEIRTWKSDNLLIEHVSPPQSPYIARLKAFERVPHSSPIEIISQPKIEIKSIEDFSLSSLDSDNLLCASLETSKPIESSSSNSENLNSSEWNASEEIVSLKTEDLSGYLADVEDIFLAETFIAAQMTDRNSGCSVSTESSQNTPFSIFEELCLADTLISSHHIKSTASFDSSSRESFWSELVSSDGVKDCFDGSSTDPNSFSISSQSEQISSPEEEICLTKSFTGYNDGCDTSSFLEPSSMHEKCYTKPFVDPNTYPKPKNISPSEIEILLTESSVLNHNVLEDCYAETDSKTSSIAYSLQSSQPEQESSFNREECCVKTFTENESINSTVPLKSWSVESSQPEFVSLEEEVCLAGTFICHQFINLTCCFSEASSPCAQDLNADDDSEVGSEVSETNCTSPNTKLVTDVLKNNEDIYIDTDISYISASCVDDDLPGFEESADSSISFTDSLLSGGEKDDSDEDYKPNVKKIKVKKISKERCCPYSPLSRRSSTILTIIPETDELYM